MTGEDGGRVYLRAMEERGHHCVVLERGEAPASRHLGFKVFCEEDLDRAEAFFAARGLPAAFVEEPYQGPHAEGRRPARRAPRVLLPHGQAALAPPALRALPGRAAAAHRPLNCFSDDVDASVAFYTGLGFRTTEYTESEDRARLWAAWMHRKGGVHDMAFTHGRRPAAAPRRVLGADADGDHRPPRPDGDHRLRRQHRAGPGAPRHLERLLPLRARPGRAPHRALLLGLPDGGPRPRADPLGPARPAAADALGAPAPRSWFEEGTPFADTPARRPAYEASPIIAA